MHSSEIDGIPVLWSDFAPPLAGVLMFRVGIADEALNTAGISHTVEHLALEQLGDHSDRCNGFVEGLGTVFYAESDEDEVKSFLEAICSSLRNLRVDQLDRERDVLRTEATGRGGGLGNTFLTQRFGSSGHGLMGCEEFGLLRLTETEVDRWRQERFTAGNAILWFTGPPPPGMNLRLPSGNRYPAPTADPVIADLPAVVAEGEGSVALSVTARRSAALEVGLDVAERMLRRRLRSELGISYDIGANYETLNLEVAHGGLVADCLKDKAASVRDEMLAVIERLSTEGLPGETVKAVIREHVRTVTDTTRHTGWLAGAALDQLCGGSPVPAEELVEELETQIDETTATAALRESLKTSLLLIPEGVDPPRSGFSEYRIDQPPPVEGEEHRPRGIPRRGVALVRGEEGMTLRTREETVTVKFDNCAAVGTWKNGDLLLISGQGDDFAIRPREWRQGGQILPHLLQHLSSDKFVPLDDAHPGPFDRVE